ncbi:MAG: DM13 domain-containing protein [Chloroflexi bacterium]|nr:DM13 domain-containing protein [Chloroflexota bacterium]
MTWLGELGSAILGGLYTYRVPVAIGGVGLAVAVLLIARRQGWVGRARRHPRATAAILVPLLAIALPVGWYLTSPLVLSATINEAPPVVAGASIATSGGSAPSSREAAGSGLPVASPAASTTSPTPLETAAPLLVRTGSFHGSDEFHFGRGTARLIETAPGTFVVRLENFAVRNGPDLFVYLSPDADGYADGAIELGRLKADTGNQNYAVPAGAPGDPDRAASVVIWCKQFSHLFATAPLAG